MDIFIGFDDTDNLESEYGTGKVARWFKDLLPEGCRCRGVVRQQLLVSDDIPYTSHNSAACMIVAVPGDGPENGLIRHLADLATDHINRHAAIGSDPGLCLAAENNSAMEGLMDFGLGCTRRVSTQKEALQAAGGVHLYGLGGTNDGLIGAAAAVGLTASGWSGRFIECGDLRGIAETITVADLNSQGIEVVSIDRDAKVPAPGDLVKTNRWLRPRLLGGKPVLLVAEGANGEAQWDNIYHKRNRKNGQ